MTEPLLTCGGCAGLGSHRRHCRRNPDYSREREWADEAERLGDMIGPNNMAAANACYRAAGLLRRPQPDLPDPPAVILDGETYERIDVTGWRVVGEGDQES